MSGHRDIPVGHEPAAAAALDGFLAAIDRLTLHRQYTVITYPDGSEILLDRYADGTCSVAVREHRSDTWSPPVPVTVVDGTDPDHQSGSLSISAEAGVE